MEATPGRRRPLKREERPWPAAQLNTKTTRPANPTTLQARGQLARAARLEAEADALQASHAYPAARRARHQANQLRRLAAGPKPEQPVVDVERALLVNQLGRWAGRGAA